MVQCKHRLRPLPGLCLVTSSVSYQGVILVLHSRLTLSYCHRVLETVVLQVRSRATQRCPREVLRRDDREGTTSVPVCLAPDRWPRELPNHESRALPEHTRDTVRRRFTLSVTARFDGTTGKAPMYWWSWPLIVVRCVVSQTAITVVCEIIIKMLNDSVDDLRGPVGLYALHSRGIRSYGLPCVVVHSKAL